MFSVVADINALPGCDDFGTAKDALESGANFSVVAVGASCFNRLESWVQAGRDTTGDS
jgi:hypothetical protein